MEKSRILVVEDLEADRLILKNLLEADYRLDFADTLKAARTSLTQSKYDIVLLDMMLPDGDGRTLCEALRKDEVQHLPIVFISASKDIEDRVEAFELGGDEFISKPFDPREVRARIRNILKWRKDSKDQGHVVHGPVTLNPNKSEVTVHSGGKKTVSSLTSIEFRLLSFFLASPGKIFSRDQLIKEVWESGVTVSPRTVDARIAGLRRKLGPVENLIESAHGKGYRLNPIQ